MNTAEPIARTPRDVRLDFFRGLAMLIIVIAHSPGNPWNDFIPARFGFSSAAEMFVFCSGFASALAFGTIFEKRGALLGLARLAARIWQLYWAQIGLFCLFAAIGIVATHLSGDTDYETRFGLQLLRDDPRAAMVGLMTLSYLPSLFDMLPMYIVILAMIPAAMMLGRVHPLAPLAAAAALWAFVQMYGVNLPSLPGTAQGWFFNPFAWQLLFFIGFSLGSGWITVPRLGLPSAMAAAALIVMASVPLNFWAFTEAFPILETWRAVIAGPGLPTNLAAARIVHFLALAYLVLSLIDGQRHHLGDALWARPMLLIGRQTLPVFLATIIIGQLMAIAFHRSEGGFAAGLLVNLAGVSAAVGVAVIATWFKRAPWRSVRPARPAAGHAVPAEGGFRAAIAPAE
jgi:hypothetical protein